MLLLLPAILLASCTAPTGDGLSRNASGPVSGLAASLDSIDGLDNRVIVDFSTPSGIPLFKKLAMFTPSWTSGALFIKQAGALKALRPDNMRLDLCLGYGGMGGSIGTGTPDHMQSDYTALDLYSKLFENNGVLPYWCYYATPYALQDSDTATPWIAPPSDYGKWYEVCRDIAKNLRENGITTFANEIWNEPDLSQFFSGTFSDYIDIYRYGSRGVRDGNPDAVVGGLSAANPDRRVRSGDLKRFLDAVTAEGLPLDFISFHAYNTNNVDPAVQTGLIREVLDGYPGLRSVRMHLNEYNLGMNALTTCSFAAPARVFDDLLALNAQTDLEVINWAMFLDANNELSLVDTFGHKMALYHAFEFYNNMPYVRRSVINASEVQAFASADDHNADVILYNFPSKSERCTVNVRLEGIPFTKGDVKVFAIDSTHSSYFDTKKSDDAEIVWEGENIPLGTLCLQLQMERYATFMIRVTDGSGLSSLDKAEPVGTFVRRDYYYTDRGKNCYAEYDRLSQTAYFGMGTNRKAQAATSVVFDDVAEPFTIRSAFSGNADGPGACGVQISWHTPDGYAEPVFYRIAGTGEIPASPWEPSAGSVREPGAAWIADPAELAPEGFDGRIRVAFIIRDMAPGSSAEVSLTKEG